MKKKKKYEVVLQGILQIGVTTTVEVEAESRAVAESTALELARELDVGGDHWSGSGDFNEDARCVGEVVEIEVVHSEDEEGGAAE